MIVFQSKKGEENVNLFLRKRIDRDVLLKAIEYLEDAHDVSWDLLDVPDYVLKPLGFFKPDINYMMHYEKMQREGIAADRMSIDNIQTMFTFFNRGERFSTGFTAEIINNRELLGVYKRLAECLRA